MGFFELARQLSERVFSGSAATTARRDDRADASPPAATPATLLQKRSSVANVAGVDLDANSTEVAGRSDVAGVAAAAQPWRDYFEERCGIRQHDGGLSRADAEAGALADCVAWWRGLNPLPASGDGACAHCGKLRPDTPVLAQGGHAWLHRACWAPMNAERDEVAREAVSAACHLRP